MNFGYLPILGASFSFSIVAAAELFSNHLRYSCFVLVAEHRHVVHRGFEVEALPVYYLIQVCHYEHTHHSVTVENVQQTAFTS